MVAKAAAVGVPIYTSSPGDSSIGMNLAFHELINQSALDDRPEPRRERGVRDHSGRREKRLRHSGRRLAQELLPCRVSRRSGRSTGFRRVGTTTSSRSRPTRLCGAGCRVRPRPKRSAGARSTPACCSDTVVAYCDTTIAFPLFCEYVVGSEPGRRDRKSLYHQRDALLWPSLNESLRRRSRHSNRPVERQTRQRRSSVGNARSPSLVRTYRRVSTDQPRIYVDANVPAGVVSTHASAPQVGRPGGGGGR